MEASIVSPGGDPQGLGRPDRLGVIAVRRHVGEASALPAHAPQVKGPVEHQNKVRTGDGFAGAKAAIATPLDHTAFVEVVHRRHSPGIVGHVGKVLGGISRTSGNLNLALVAGALGVPAGIGEGGGTGVARPWDKGQFREAWGAVRIIAGTRSGLGACVVGVGIAIIQPPARAAGLGKADVGEFPCPPGATGADKVPGL